MTISSRWHDRTLAEGEWTRFDIGELTIIVRSIYEEWRLAIFRGEERAKLSDDPATPPSDDWSWERWDRAPDDKKLYFRPAFPDRPVITKPRSTLHLSAQGRTHFYVGVPAFIDVHADCEGVMTKLTTIPSVPLSNTWHGTPMAGTLCYASRTRARRYYDPSEWPPEEILCTFDIINERSTTLPFERLYLDTGHLAVFEKDENLWANACRIRVEKTSESLSDITYATKPSAPNDDAEELTPPRAGRSRRSKLSDAFRPILDPFHAFSS